MPKIHCKVLHSFFSVLAGLLKCHNLSALGCLWYGRTFQMNGGAFQKKMHLRPSHMDSFKLHPCCPRVFLL
jgi:hypothetical protein